MKKFNYVESNNTVELAILMEAYIQKLEKKFDRGEIEPEEYIFARKQTNELIDKTKNLIEQWKEKLSE